MTERPAVLVPAPLMPYCMEELEKRFAVTLLSAQPDPAAFLASQGGAFRAIATSTFVGCKAELVDALPALEIISSFGVGTDSLAVAHAREKNIIVTNTPDVLNEETANLGIALLLAVTRNLVANDRYVRAGRWVKEGDAKLGRGLAGRQVGIVGMGRIGQVIARKLEVFGCPIAYHTRTAKRDLPWRHVPDLIQLARDSAALIVIVPGGPATAKLIDRQVMEALGPEGVLVNVARGSVVDEAALVDMLATGALGGAGIDVWEDEPNVPEALFGLDNVVLQPHVGSATVETRRAMADLTVANLERHFDGRPPLTPLP